MSWFRKESKHPRLTRKGVIAVQPEESRLDIAASSGVDELSRQDQIDSIRNHRDGLLQLKPLGLNSYEGPYCLDIVAIHGLNGNVYTTWTKEGSPLWLLEDLPRSLPGARIYAYGYDSRIRSASRGGVRDWAKALLHSLNSQRRTETLQKRGIIFLCHSLGGIVCKKALVEANEDKSFANILKSTKAIVFFGTPHSGSAQADFGSILALMAQSVETISLTDRFTGQRIRRELADLLKRESKELEELSMSFRNRVPGIKIVSFYEQNTIQGFKKLIVPSKSALLNCSEEVQLPSLGKDHRTMCRLDKNDDAYETIINICENYINGMSNEDARVLEIEQTEKAQLELEQQERRSHEKDFEKQQKCLNALHLVEIEMMDRRAHFATPIPGTCDWILSYPKFRTWISSNRSDVLHLTGEMGSGKTTVVSFLVNYFKSLKPDDAVGLSSRPFTICSFFCSDQHYHFRDAEWILRGILYQLLDQNKPLLRSMHTSIVGLGDIPAESWNQSLLWPRLEQALNSALTGPVMLIIDALDECQESSISLLLENIGRLLQQKSQNQNSCVKVLISSRPSMNLKGAIQPFITTLDTEELFERLQQDVHRLVNYEMGRLATAGNWTQEMRTNLERELGGKAGVSFLWVRLVLNRLENGSQDPLRLQKVIDESPKDLDQFYCHILAGIDDDNRDLATKMLRILVGSMRPLTTKEFIMALAILSSGNASLPLEEIEKARDRNIKQSIRNVLKSLACVRGDKVQLYHLSTKEFLLRLSQGKVNDLASLGPRIQTTYGITLHAANLDLARACITFLGLDDFNEDMDKTQDESLSSFAELPAYMGDDDGLSSASIDGPASPTWSSSSSEEGSANEKILSVNDKIKKHLFYAYSATYWALHLRLVGPTTTKELLESSIHISDPSENCLMHWSDLYRSSSQEWVALPKPLDPLIISAFFGIVSLGNEVLEQSINLAENNKSLALCWACRMGHSDVVEMLLAHKTNLTGSQLDGRWPISWACANGHLEIVKILLKKDYKSQINLPDHKNRSPISLAIEFGDPALTKLLLAIEGIDLDLADNDGNTLIHWSVGSKMGQNDIKQLRKLLTVNKIDVAKRDKRGRNVLSWAAEQGDLKAINVLLNSKRPEINALLQDTGDLTYGRSPLGYAAFYGHADVVEALCKTGKVDAQLASVDHKGQNAFMLAADRNNWEVAQVLVKYYPKGIDVPNQDGRTALSAAMWADDNENNAKTIRILIRSGADVNSKTRNGRTPLSFAASAGKVNLIRILVEEGNASMDIFNTRGTLPDEIRAEANQIEVNDEFRRLRAARSPKKT